MTSSLQPQLHDCPASDVLPAGPGAGIAPADLNQLLAAHTRQQLDCLPLQAFANQLEPAGAVWAEFGLADDEETDATEGDDDWEDDELDEDEDWEDDELDEDEDWEDDELDEDEDWEDDEDWADDAEEDSEELG